MTTQELISQAYEAFNQRNIDAALSLMSEGISWPKASEGGRVVGKRAIREYWTRQWAEFDPHVDVLDMIDDETGKTDVTVRQVVKSLQGDILADMEVRHVYTIADGLIERMDIDDDGGSDDPSTAFSRSDRAT